MLDNKIYDNLGNQIDPGDTVCYFSQGELKIGEVKRISKAGTLFIAQYHPRKRKFLEEEFTRTQHVIRVSGLAPNNHNQFIR